MPRKGDPPNQELFEFVDRADSSERQKPLSLRRTNAAHSSRQALDGITADGTSERKSKRAQRRERGRRKANKFEYATSNNTSAMMAGEVPSLPGTIPVLRGKLAKAGGILALLGLVLSLFTGPKDVFEAVSTYRGWFSPPQSAPAPQTEKLSELNQPPFLTTTTGSIERVEISGKPVRERSIASAVSLLGGSNYEDQLRKFEALLKAQLIEEPGWKGVLRDIPDFHEDIKKWCVGVRDPLDREAEILVCSEESISNFRSRDCVRVVGIFSDYPPAQKLVVTGILRIEKSGCNSGRKRDASLPTTVKSGDKSTWWESVFGK